VRFDGGGSSNDYNNLLTERGGTDLARSHDSNNLLTVRQHRFDDSYNLTAAYALSGSI
jgi:hypothetical protein